MSEPVESPPRTVYTAVRIEDGETLRIWFEASMEEKAREYCRCINAGFEGRAGGPEIRETPLPEAYNVETSCQILGGISPSTLYREIADGKLERFPGTRRVLITRASLEARAKWRALAQR